MRLLALVVGAGGQLGEAMTSQLAPIHEVVARTRAELDVTSLEAVRQEVAAICPDVIINCAAYTNVDGAESDPVAAFSANAWAVRTLARAANEADAAFVHYSTDFVFDGRIDRPYTEDDAPNPRGTYAMSKLLGEWLAAEVPRHYVLRVESLFGGPGGHSSVDKILANILAGAEVKAFCDRTVSPSFVDDVVAATAGLFAREAPYGLYHCVNSGWTTWNVLAREIATIAGRPDAQITDVPMAAAKLIADRPKFAALSNAKLVDAGVAMPTWQEALRRYINVTRNEDR